jgi:hypothetical protein
VTNNNIISIATEYDLFSALKYSSFYDISATFMTMGTAIDEQFLLTYQYIDTKDGEQHTYTDEQITQL